MSPVLLLLGSAVLAPCPIGITAQNVEQLARALEAIESDECELTAVNGLPHSITVHWMTPSGSTVELMLEPRECADAPGFVGAQLAARDMAPVQHDCPATAAGLVHQLESDIGETIETSRPPLIDTCLLAWISALLVLLAALWLGHRRGAGSTMRWPSGVAGTVIVSTVVTAVTVNLVLQTTAAFDDVLFENDWYLWFAFDSRTTIHTLLHALYPMFGHNLVGYVAVAAGVHVINGALVFQILRDLGSPRPMAAAAVAIFLTTPLLYVVLLETGSLLELILQIASLGTVIAFSRRIEAPGRLRAIAWGAVELLFILVGVGTKESFLSYPALLAAYAIARAAVHRESWVRSGWLRILAPELAFFAVALVTIDLGFLGGVPMIAPAAAVPEKLAATISRAFTLGIVSAPPVWVWLALGASMLASVRAFRGQPAFAFGVFTVVLWTSPMALVANHSATYAYHPWLAMAFLSPALLELLTRTVLGKALSAIVAGVVILHPIVAPIDRSAIRVALDELPETATHVRPLLQDVAHLLLRRDAACELRDGGYRLPAAIWMPWARDVGRCSDDCAQWSGMQLRDIDEQQDLDGILTAFQLECGTRAPVVLAEPSW